MCSTECHRGHSNRKLKHSVPLQSTALAKPASSDPFNSKGTCTPVSEAGLSAHGDPFPRPQLGSAHGAGTTGNTTHLVHKALEFPRGPAQRSRLSHSPTSSQRRQPRGTAIRSRQGQCTVTGARDNWGHTGEQNHLGEELENEMF